MIMSVKNRAIIFCCAVFLLLASCASESDKQLSSQPARFQQTEVSVDLPKAMLPTHSLGGQQPLAADSAQTQTQVNKIDRVPAEDGSKQIIFQGNWLHDKPHGAGTCYRESDKLKCHYFEGILVHFEGEAKRNAAMYRCLGIATDQLERQHAHLSRGSVAYKQQQRLYLKQCYQLTEQMFNRRGAAQ